MPIASLPMIAAFAVAVNIFFLTPKGLAMNNQPDLSAPADQSHPMPVCGSPGMVMSVTIFSPTDVMTRRVVAVKAPIRGVMKFAATISITGTIPGSQPTGVLSMMFSTMAA